MADADTTQIVQETAERCRNWGKWGEDDQLGTLNYITSEKVIQAATLVQSGKVISLATAFDESGPQSGGGARHNPIHLMLATGTDAAAGAQRFGDSPPPHGFGYSDDAVSMPLQCATQWDGLAHIFHNNTMWNGYPASDVTARGAQRNGIEQLREKMVTRGILLDVARQQGVEALEPGYGITPGDLDACLDAAGLRVTPGDIVLVRTGQMGYCKANGWGTYAGGDAPGLSFSTADWLHQSEIAAIATDTWGVEVRPNELPDSFQPLHCVMIPNMGLLVGEIFDLESLGADCAEDGVYEFLFVAPPLPITGAVGSPINPQAIK
jgi:kynurenine formamidase